MLVSEFADGVRSLNPYTGRFDSLSINDRGDVSFLGTSTTTGQIGVYLLAIPEPGTALLLGLGLVGLGFR